MPDGEPIRQRRDVSTVIDIEMRDQQMVDAVQTGGLDSFQNPIGGCRPGIQRGPANIDEQRFPGRRNEQDALASLDIHGIYVEGIGGRQGGNEKRQKQTHVEKSHGFPFTGHGSRKPAGGWAS